MMFTLMKILKKGKHMRYKLHILKTGRKKSLKKIGWAIRLSSQIQKLCNTTDNMSQAKSNLTPVMDLYGIPQVVKVLDNMLEEVPEASHLYFFSLKLLLNKDKRIMFLSISPKIRA
ncbi:DNA repair recO [Gossypium arboreum]|nr:DNA repair recO [Gossypium arboreum]